MVAVTTGHAAGAKMKRWASKDLEPQHLLCAPPRGSPTVALEQRVKDELFADDWYRVIGHNYGRSSSKYKLDPTLPWFSTSALRGELARAARLCACDCLAASRRSPFLHTDLANLAMSVPRVPPIAAPRRRLAVMASLST